MIINLWLTEVSDSLWLNPKVRGLGLPGNAVGEQQQQ